MAEITGFTGDAGGDEALADMAVDAVNAGMRRDQVGGVLRRHGVAGFTAEGGGVGVFPAIGACSEHQQGENALRGYRAANGPTGETLLVEKRTCLNWLESASFQEISL